MIVEALVRTVNLETILKATADLGFDAVAGERGDPFTPVYFDISDYGTLIAIGYIAGLEVCSNKLKSL